MKATTRSHFLQLPATLLVLSAMSASAAVLYVDVNSASPTPPYTNWSTAATTIQDAVDAADPGDTVIVTNGVYQTGGRVVHGILTNRVAVTKPLTVRSVNGSESTVIQGYKVPGQFNGGCGESAVRCVYLTNNAVLVGFTLTNGATGADQFEGDPHQLNGGGVWCELNGGVILSNCVLVANSAFEFGGGDYYGTLFHCTLSNNIASCGGGGSYGGSLFDCTINSNSVGRGACASGIGGGASHVVLNNCTLSGNSAGQGGGAASSTLENCVLTTNVASGFNCSGSGGGAFNSIMSSCILRGNSATHGGGASDSSLNNCTLIGNSSALCNGLYGTSGAGGGAYSSALNNCTIIGNSAPSGGGVSFGTLRNSIIYNNTATNGSNYSGGTLSYCCVPALTNGVGNITSNPLFEDYAGGNLRLQSNSPCINAGNNTYVTNSMDLDGNPRIAGGTVDMGAYEFQSPGSVISYAWLQRYGFPIDGSADFTDTDGDSMNNYGEWRSDTIPTNSLSVLRLLNPTGGASGVNVSWQSVSNRTYFLERASDFGVQPPFSLLKSNLVGQAGTTAFMDTNAVGNGPFFYRVGVPE